MSYDSITLKRSNWRLSRVRKSALFDFDHKVIDESYCLPDSEYLDEPFHLQVSVMNSI